ncbi:MAG: ExeM/NucH family extracellular endonuclease [Prevotellaceae bacterium]|jgi:predicted extracellular nuclease|nr:ExeM/NucH family extracellular endonuclease [Prevotellaceae bacterium]
MYYHRYIRFSLSLMFGISCILHAQPFCKIYDISRSNRQEVSRLGISTSVAEQQAVITEGVITLVLPHENGVTHFFIQDFLGDNNAATSDAIAARTYTDGVLQAGDEVVLRGVLYDDGRHVLLDSVSVVSKLGADRAVAAKAVHFPDDFTSWAAYDGMTLTFDQTLYVTSNAQWQRNGQLTLSSQRLRSPTEAALPGSAAYTSLVAENNTNQIILDDGSSVTNPTTLPFADANGTRRTGSRVDNLTAILTNTSRGYMLYPVGTPLFYGNPRPETPPLSGEYNLKVCGFNLEYYLASDYGNGYGPDNATLAAQQHQKILQAMLAIDADIYGLVEIQSGQTAIAKLCTAMNQASGTGRYSYINDGTSVNGTFTKAGYIYRNDRVTPISDIKHNNTGVSNRKKAQGFRLLSNGESFIFCINHFKAKSGTGTGNDSDQGDGQGTFNASRVEEANSVVKAIHTSYISYYNDSDVLIMGDLNAYAKENPLTVFETAGYSNLLKRFEGDSAYSYVYQAAAGCLDHALANATLAQQVVDATVFHINTDEPTCIGYDGSRRQDNMYRSSDHDPVVVTLLLGVYSDTILAGTTPTVLQNNSLSPDIFTVLNGQKQWMSVLDARGRILHKIFLKEQEVSFSIAELMLSQGIYLLQFDDMKSSKPTSGKLIVPS